jgi:hypothetical protein
MKTVLLCITAALFFSTAAWAEPSPAIDLNPGENLVTLSLENAWNRTITGLDVTIESSALPSWLAFEGTERPVDLAQGETAAGALALKFKATNPPSGITLTIPVTLSDTQGNCWKVSLTVASKATEGVPSYIDALNENYPNPFNPTTTISFSLKESRHATLFIYNALGQKVRTLADGPLTAGLHSLVWDGRDDSGRKVSSGMYVYTLRAGTFVKTRRMMMVE